MYSKKLASVLASALTVTVVGSACAGNIAFEEVPVPTTDAEKRAVVASPSVNIDGRDYAIGYNTILRSGDQVGDSDFLYGQLINARGEALLNADGSPRISNSADFNSLIRGEDGKLYLVSQFEDSIGVMYVTRLKQKDNGELKAEKTRPIDFSSVNGGWTHCAGSVTPWNTHLGSEEYEPNAANPDILNDKYFGRMHEYFGGAYANPYDYGFGIEVEVKNFSHANVTKHYAMGRFAWELGYVMPDQKTVYASDDGTNVGLFRFVADEKGDLSTGYLYVAKWIQTSAEGIGEAKIEWVNLGHASNDDIKPFLDSKGAFSDIFEQDVEGCTSINTTFGNECLKVRDGMETIASRLETRRYAAMMGATTEFRKMEGITYNPDAHVMYLAMSEVDRGMLDHTRVGKGGPGSYPKYDEGGWNHMTIAEGNKCGAVYALDLDGNFAATSMYGVVAGTPGGDTNNSCDVDGIANPDNITYIPGYNTLIIGEDTGSGHQNDAIWSYNLDDKELTRIETTPYGSETTSPYFYPNVGGHGYLMSVIQHPYGESDRDKLENPADARAYVGFVGPFPPMAEHRRHHRHHEHD